MKLDYWILDVSHPCNNLKLVWEKLEGSLSTMAFINKFLVDSWFRVIRTGDDIQCCVLSMVWKLCMNLRLIPSRPSSWSSFFTPGWYPVFVFMFILFKKWKGAATTFLLYQDSRELYCSIYYAFIFCEVVFDLP